MKFCTALERTLERVQVQDEGRVWLSLGHDVAGIADDHQAPVQVVVDGHEHEAELEQVHLLPATVTTQSAAIQTGMSAAESAELRLPHIFQALLRSEVIATCSSNT